MNTTLASGIARNKYLTRKIVHRVGGNNIPYLRTSSTIKAQKFLAEHGRIIVKPIKGQGARNISIVETGTELAVLPLKGMILEKYSPGREIRYLVLDGRVIAVHESVYGNSVEHDRYLERTSYPESEWDPVLSELSVRICNEIGLGFAAIDYITDEDGSSWLLEVNSAPGLKWFHRPTSGPSVDVALQLLQATFRANQ
jgi:glutathione synthase/RimK-type ligase-like ATP-grasp enzyme